ncbi:MAG: ribonuclease P protein component [Bacteroidales bacterium]|jgi:ribonuclease P protein component|nr:ribonuclease P protein component [Bacteroidales bacterium]
MEKPQHISHSFPKNERLHGHNAISTLFANGQSFYVYPFKVIFVHNKAEEDGTEVRILISVSKKKVKNAVDRNHIKRMIREAWRLNKQAVINKVSSVNKQIDIALIYTGQQTPEFILVQKKIKAIIKRLIQDYEVAD